MVTNQQFSAILEMYGLPGFHECTIITNCFPETLFVITSNIDTRLVEINKTDIIPYNSNGNLQNVYSNLHYVLNYIPLKVNVIGTKYFNEISYFIGANGELNCSIYDLKFIFSQRFNNIVVQANIYNLPLRGLGRFFSIFREDWVISLKDLSTLYHLEVSLENISEPVLFYKYKTLFSCSLIDAYNYCQTNLLSWNYTPCTKKAADRVRKDIRYCSTYMQAGFSSIIYRDYISILDNWNITDRKHYPRYPEDFTRIQRLHDNLVSYIRNLNNHVDESFNLNYQKEYYNLAKKFEYSNDNYSIIACKDLSELHYEGNVLNHCVGSYVDSVGNGKEYILFLRKNNDIETPFYTIDVTPNNIVRQIHGKCNCNVIVELEPFIKEWASKFNLDISNYNGCKNCL